MQITTQSSFVTESLVLPQEVALVPRKITEGFAADVRAGLSKSQKELPAKYLYDEVGSALFETITVLPEYGLTRADERLLRRHAEEMVRPLLPAPVVVAE